MTGTRPPSVQPPRVNATWVRRIVAEAAETLALHVPDNNNRCARCVRVGLLYHGSPAAWPCDPHLFAEGRLKRFDPDGELRHELAQSST